MATIFLGDNFSVDEQRFFGKAFANRSLLKALFVCEHVEHVVAIGDSRAFGSLGIGTLVARKLKICASINELQQWLMLPSMEGVVCSSFGSKYAQAINFRNLMGMQCPVYGFTHSLSYQHEVNVLYNVFCANPALADTILCTSHAAIDVMRNLTADVRGTLAFSPAGPRLHHFPLAFEAGPPSAAGQKHGERFQVLFMGRLDWQTKADVLIIPVIASLLPRELRIHFVIAGACENKEYVEMLRQSSAGLPVEILTDLAEDRKQALFAESHVLLSPSDNYQETFGLSVLEAKSNGCVPVISDFNGYRDLIKKDEDGVLLPTIAARITDLLWQFQAIAPMPNYHGWWAAGVSIDPADAAREIGMLARDRERWQRMSDQARRTVTEYGVEATARRFQRLLEEGVSAWKTTGPAVTPAGYSNPLQIDYSKTFRGHPSAFWDSQEIAITERGNALRDCNATATIPQLGLLWGTLSANEIHRLLTFAETGCTASQCMAQGIPALALSVALKNGLIRLVE